MRSLKRVMELLFESNYLQAIYSGDKIGMKLLRNGETYQKLLLDQWRNDVAQLATSKETKDEETSRLSFMNSRSFKETLQELVRTDAFVSETTIKTVVSCTADSLNDSNYRVLNNQRNKLVTEYFVPAPRGQDTFYSVQRERKIWWMRFSADPSRYFVDSYDVSQELDDDGHSVSTKIQSVTIKSLIFDNPMDMETITLIPLGELKRVADKSYLHFDLIRSVIDIDLTTCGKKKIVMHIPKCTLK